MPCDLSSRHLRMKEKQPQLFSEKNLLLFYSTKNPAKLPNKEKKFNTAKNKVTA
jgi:hypothetical protein